MMRLFSRFATRLFCASLDEPLESERQGPITEFYFRARDMDGARAWSAAAARRHRRSVTAVAEVPEEKLPPGAAYYPGCHERLARAFAGRLDDAY